MTIRRTLQITVLTFALAAVVAGLGCSTKPDDTKITQAVQIQLHNNTAIAGDVSVSSAGGVVTLNGHVSSEAARQLAARDAAGVEGVRVVTNNLTVAPTADMAATPPPTPSVQPAPAPVASNASSRRSEPSRGRRAVTQPRVNETAAVKTPEPVTPVAPPQTASTLPVYPPPPEPVAVAAPLPPPPPSKYTIPAGTVLTVRLIDSLDSSKNRVGDTFRASLDAPVRLDGEVVIPSGLSVEGRVVEASNAGTYSGHAELSMELTKLTASGEAFPLRTDQYNRAGGGRGKGTAETVGAGAGLGAIIGGIAGGGKGAAIGAIAGAGAGGVARAANKSEKISFPSETALSFRLEQPLTVPASMSSARGTGSVRDFDRSNDRNDDPLRPRLKRRAENLD